MRRLAVMLTLTLLVLGATASTADAGGGGACHDAHQELASNRVEIQQYCFTQTVVHIAPGASVTWTNYDETPHTVTGSGVEWGDFEGLATRESVTHEFVNPGVYPYFCELHPGMVGAVVVDGAASGTQLAAAVPIASDHGGSPMLAWIVGGALLGLAAVLVTSFVVTRRRRPVPA